MACFLFCAVIALFLSPMANDMFTFSFFQLTVLFVLLLLFFLNQERFKHKIKHEHVAPIVHAVVVVLLLREIEKGLTGYII
jgi:hypothetical protein